MTNVNQTTPLENATVSYKNGCVGISKETLTAKKNITQTEEIRNSLTKALIQETQIEEAQTEEG